MKNEKSFSSNFCETRIVRPWGRWLSRRERIASGEKPEQKVPSKARRPRMDRAAMKCVALATFFILLMSCSTTKRLSENETLYTGVRKMRVENSVLDQKGKPQKVPSSVEAAVREPLSVKPNNPLFSPWVRTPLPIGLWAYNSFYTEKTKGFRAWMYRTFAKQPVLMERDVQPAARVGMVRDILDNHGYFGSSAEYELVPKHNPKKSKVSYRALLARPWFYTSVDFWADSLAARSNVKAGEQYNIDTLTREKVRIANLYRRRGYYFFRPEYVEYQADTTRTAYGVDLRVRLAGGIPQAALVPYNVGNVSFRIFSADNRGEFRTVDIHGVTVSYQEPLRVRRNVLRRALTLHEGETARLGSIDRVMSNLTRLGVFRYVNLEVPSVDSLGVGAPLDLIFSAAMDTPMADLAYKSSSFLGPSLALGLSHKNIFGGGEVLGLRLNGSYEWQTGNTSAGAHSTAVNSYEIGLTGSLVFPRILAPDFIGRRLRRGGSTAYAVGANLMNRPKFFRMVSFDFTNTYEFRTSRTVTHTLVPFKMVYNRLLSTTADFDATMAANPAIAMSFADQFIPSGSYTYTYDSSLGYRRRDRLTFQASATTAGNIWGVLGANKLFGQPLSQFFRETAEVRYFKSLTSWSQLAFRFFAGAGHAYGNSTVMPYTEQFYIGGANSIRAFTIRSIGPGGYVPTGDRKYGYFDQTGDLKLEFNVEYRFRIAGPLNGAVFFDAGNIWLQKQDETRPLGRIGSGPFFGQVATGTGVGVRYDLSFLVLRFDLGVGIHLPYDTGRSGYYNIPRFRDGLGLHLAIGYPF